MAVCMFMVSEFKLAILMLLLLSLHSGQAGGQKSWETKIHKCVRQSGEMIGLHGDDHESLFGPLGSLIWPLEASQNDPKPLKMAISGTFKLPSQTASLFSFNMHLQHIPYVHYICKRHLTGVINHLRSPSNDQKPLKMAISGTFKHPIQT